tara:strand:- start:41 stop:199 length:159 start_codon:yes stop_codon:yes gene_type:complete
MEFQEVEISQDLAHLNTFLQLRKMGKEIFGLEIEILEFGNMMEILLRITPII